MGRASEGGSRAVFQAPTADTLRWVYVVVLCPALDFSCSFFLLPVHLSRDGGSKQVFPIVKEVKEFVLLGRIKYVSFRTLPSSRLVLLSLGEVSSSSPLHLSENSMCELFPVGSLCFIVLLHSLP